MSYATGSRVFQFVSFFDPCTVWVNEYAMNKADLSVYKLSDQKNLFMCAMKRFARIIPRVLGKRL